MGGLDNGLAGGGCWPFLCWSLLGSFLHFLQVGSWVTAGLDIWVPGVPPCDHPSWDDSASQVLSMWPCFKIRVLGLPRWLSGKKSACQCRGLGFEPCIGKIPWRRKWQPTPVFLPGKSHGQRSLTGCRPRGHKESDTTYWLNNNLDIILESSAAAAAAAESLHSCPTLCDPIGVSPPGSPALGRSRQEHWSGLPFPSPMCESETWKWSRSVVSDSWWPHGPQPTRLLHPWDFLGKSTGVGSQCFLPLESSGHGKRFRPS